jgi:signal transduction histidine kinase
MYAAYAAVVALRHRPELSYRLRAFGFCALVFVTGAAALFSLGLLPGPTLVCAFVVIAARLFLGAQAMLLSLVLSTFAIVLASLSHAPGAPWPPVVPMGTRFWLRSALAYSMPTAAIAMMVAFVVMQIEQSLQATAAALLRSSTAEAERERTQEALAKTEQALLRSQKLEAVGRLAAGVGHDFNNTLQVMLSWASILRGERDEHTLDEGLAAIESAAQQGRELTQRLLTFGRRDARAPTRASLAKLVGESARSLRRLLPENIGIELDLDKDAPELLIDADQLAHVLLNLGLNARDAMPSGGTLYFTVTALSASELPEGVEAPGQADELVHVSVRDTGTGMSDETLGHLFEPFYTTKGDRGTGLGLATAYALVERNAGTMRVESAVAQGSTFHLYFPAQQAESAPRASVVRTRRPIEAGVVMVEAGDLDVSTPATRTGSSSGSRG